MKLKLDSLIAFRLILVVVTECSEVCNYKILMSEIIILYEIISDVEFMVVLPEMT